MKVSAHRLRRPSLVILDGGAARDRTSGSVPPSSATSSFDESAAVESVRVERLTDEQLVEAVQRGDGAIPDQLYHRLVDAVDVTLYRIFGRREPDHEDMIQLAFEQIVLTLSRRSYAGACSLRTWATAVTSRVAFNVLRARRRERAVVVPTLDEPPEAGVVGSDGECQSLARAELERLRVQLARMKPERAQAVFLHDALGHELAEIAAMEGISVAAAQSRLVRGRKELYKRLGLLPTGRRKP